MNVKEYVNGLCRDAKDASYALATSSSTERNAILISISKKLCEEENIAKIIEANRLDLEHAKNNNIRPTMIDRLTLSRERLTNIAASASKLAALPDVLGQGECFVRPNGLKIRRVAVPLGTVGIIYEARPNVTVDAAGICIKTGNCAVLRGGKEAINSNKAFISVIHSALTECGFDPHCIALIEDTSRESSYALMEAVGLIDVLIPRGSKSLINSVCQNARVPVIETGAGNCHIYVEKTADIDTAVKVTLNAKLSRPSVCNAAESLLVDRAIAGKFLPRLYSASREKELIFRGNEEVKAILPQAEDACEEDYYAEYYDYIISVKLVDGVKEAVENVNKYSTHHSEAVLTSDLSVADYFTSHVDSAAVYVNASTRFTDGEEFGFGAEIGISTQKLHARGPMGPEQLTIYKYIIEGNGQIR